MRLNIDSSMPLVLFDLNGVFVHRIYHANTRTWTVVCRVGIDRFLDGLCALGYEHGVFSALLSSHCHASAS